MLSNTNTAEGFISPLDNLVDINQKMKGFPGGWAGKESACTAGDLGSIPGLGRSPGERKGYPFQFSGLDNSMYYIVHGVTKSWTRLNDIHFLFKKLKEISLHLRRNPCAERNWAILPAVSKELRSSATSPVSATFWKWITQPQVSLWMAAALVNQQRPWSRTV